MNDNEDHIALTKRVIEHLRWSRDDDKNAEVLSRVIRGEFKRVAEEEREACAQILQAEKERLSALVATVTIGGRAGKWQGGIDALETTLAAIRARGEEDHP